MKKLLYVFLFIGGITFLFQCKSDGKGENNSDNNPNDDPYMVHHPKDYYWPPGLKQMSMLDMYDVRKLPDLIKVPLKDKHGNDVPHTIMNDPRKPMFIQLFANDSNRIVVGVVYEPNDEIRKIMMKVKEARPKEQPATADTIK